MTIKEIKKLFVEFGKTLDNKEKDEWWATDRGRGTLCKKCF